MSLYPSLEDMKVDRMYQAQFQADAHNTLPAVNEMPGNNLPYPLVSNPSLYPSITEYMGLDLSPSVLAANMPEYMPENALSSRQDFSVMPSVGGLVAPLSGNDRGLQRAHVTNGIGEMLLCKEKGKLGIRLQAIDNGIFVSVVSKDSTAAQAGLRFGDQILQIQGKDVAGMSADEAHKLIKNAPDTGLQIIKRDRPLERTITLHKDSNGIVGFQFKNGKITNLVADSSAARNGLLTNHQILEINGQNVVGLKDKEITKIIESLGTIVTVTVVPSFIYEHMTKKIASSLFNTMDHSVF